MGNEYCETEVKPNTDGEVKVETYLRAGDGGGAGENAQRGGTQEDCDQLQLLHRSHETAGEQAETQHQQI